MTKAATVPPVEHRFLPGRERAKKEYRINLKAELELRVMHGKRDHLTQQQALASQQVAEILHAVFNRRGQR